MLQRLGRSTIGFDVVVITENPLSRHILDERYAGHDYNAHAESFGEEEHRDRADHAPLGQNRTKPVVVSQGGLVVQDSISTHPRCCRTKLTTQFSRSSHIPDTQLLRTSCIDKTPPTASYNTAQGFRTPTPHDEWEGGIL